MASLVQKLVVEDVAKASRILPQRGALANPDGTAFAGKAGPKGASVKAIELVADAGGAITGGTATLTDGKTVDIAVTVASS